MSELLPCPFCGGEALLSTRFDEDIWTHNQVEWTEVKCRCGRDDINDAPCAEPSVSWPTHATNSRDVALAIAAWNRRAPAWQPISTAPENETILVCQSQNGIICTARGRNKHGDWRTGVGPMDYIAAVTHWQPLPAPPQEPAGGEIK